MVSGVGGGYVHSLNKHLLMPCSVLGPGHGAAVIGSHLPWCVQFAGGKIGNQQDLEEKSRCWGEPGWASRRK